MLFAKVIRNKIIIIVVIATIIIYNYYPYGLWHVKDF